jgi:HPt (histidine-containing phosphotransfer) domain-containing protein
MDQLDQDVLARLRKTRDQELLAKLTELFLEDAPYQLEALREAIRVGDAPRVERVAHTLKGSSGHLGALRMSTICVELQDVGHRGELERAPVLVERLGAEFGRVRTALETEIEHTRG